MRPAPRDILGWRSRCYRRQRDFEAAREDVERALELAEGAGRPPRRSPTRTSRLRSSPSARATGCSPATTPSARRRCYEELADERNVGRLLNNLGGLNFLLGKPEEAIAYLKERSRVALEAGSDVGRRPGDSARSRRCTSHSDDVELAEEQARQALELLEGRDDFLDEIGNVAARARPALSSRAASTRRRQSFRPRAELRAALVRQPPAGVWVALGDLASRGRRPTAARLYRSAAEALQDFRFYGRR